MNTSCIPLTESRSPRRKRQLTLPKDKYARHRIKCLMEGRCPHCGKPCAPYSECQERRAKKRLFGYLAKGIKNGDIIRTSPGFYMLSDAGRAKYQSQIS